MRADKTRRLLEEGVDAIRSDRVVGDDERQTLGQELDAALAELAAIEGGLVLDQDARVRLTKFREEGLVYLVNTAVLHPRGLALAIHVDDDSEAIGLSIVGAGDEPWCFAEDDLDDVVDRYHEAERAREADWSPKLRHSYSDPKGES